MYSTVQPGRSRSQPSSARSEPLSNSCDGARISPGPLCFNLHQKVDEAQRGCATRPDLLMMRASEYRFRDRLRDASHVARDPG